MSLVRVSPLEDEPGQHLWLWCPACEEPHMVVVDAPGRWAWDGREDAPTIVPSIKVTGVQWDESYPFHKSRHRVAAGQPIVCHSFVRAGQWEFQNDCTHDLAGQTAPLVPLPDWMLATETT